VVELGLLGELKVATEGSSASPFICRRSGNSSQLQPPPLMAATVAERRLVGVAERSGGTEAMARRARRGGGAAAVKRRGGQAPQWPAAGAALARRAARLGDGTARAEGSVALQQLAGVSGFWPGCPLVRELGVPWPCAAAGC